MIAALFIALASDAPLLSIDPIEPFIAVPQVDERPDEHTSSVPS